MQRFFRNPRGETLQRWSALIDDDRRWIERLIESTERTAEQLRSRETEDSRRLVKELDALRERLLAKLREESR